MLSACVLEAMLLKVTGDAAAAPSLRGTVGNGALPDAVGLCVTGAADFIPQATPDQGFSWKAEIEAPSLAGHENLLARSAGDLRRMDCP